MPCGSSCQPLPTDAAMHSGDCPSRHLWRLFGHARGSDERASFVESGKGVCRAEEIHIDWRVLCLGMGISLFAASFSG
jgi:hypothetical protein